MTQSGCSSTTRDKLARRRLLAPGTVSNAFPNILSQQSSITTTCSIPRRLLTSFISRRQFLRAIGVTWSMISGVPVSEAAKVEMMEEGLAVVGIFAGESNMLTVVFSSGVPVGLFVWFVCLVLWFSVCLSGSHSLGQNTVAFQDPGCLFVSLFVLTPSESSPVAVQIPSSRSPSVERRLDPWILSNVAEGVA